MALNKMTSLKPLGIYLHIPFCIEKCKYCAFTSFGGIDVALQEAYINKLIEEVEYYGEIYNNKYYVDTIFIGGGTPSLIDETLIAKLLDAVRACFIVRENAEITIESNPKTLTVEKLLTYRKIGINRLSMGVQSMNDELLKFVGRAHNSNDVLSNMELARKCGFDNINLDLIFAIPGQTMEVWLDTLKKTIELKPEHISVYSLQFEEGTPLYELFESGRISEIDDELDREMYHQGLAYLKENGYNHYEISNLAKEGRQCRHNLKYWSLEEYFGFGLGAHSYIDGKRLNNIVNLDKYINANSINELVADSHVNNKEEDISEYIITGMRKIEGIDLSDFEKRFGKSLETLYNSQIQRLTAQKLIKIDGKYMKFTEKGIDLSNTVLAEFV